LLNNRAFIGVSQDLAVFDRLWLVESQNNSADSEKHDHDKSADCGGFKELHENRIGIALRLVFDLIPPELREQLISARRRG
jgi:hypothetical protein